MDEPTVVVSPETRYICGINMAFHKRPLLSCGYLDFGRNPTYRLKMSLYRKQ